MKSHEKVELLMQCDLVGQVRMLAEGIHPTIDLSLPVLAELYSSLNGVRISIRQAVEQKAAGMRSGIPDLHLPVGRDGYLSLYIEMKTLTGALSADQKRAHRSLRAQGNKVAVCRAVGSALTELITYSQGVPTYARREVK